MRQSPALLWTQYIRWALSIGLLGALGMGKPAIGLHHVECLATDLAVQVRWDMLELTMSIPKREFRPGEPVEVHFRLENTGDASVVFIDIPFQTFDLVVYDDKGSKVWAWTKTRALPLGVPGARHLMHGEALSNMLAWDRTLPGSATGIEHLAPQGTYFIEGILNATLQQAPTVKLQTPRLPITLIR
jgi:hypothetical protein